MQKIKKYLLIVDQRYKTIKQMKNLDQHGLKEILLLCSEEDTIWMIDDKIKLNSPRGWSFLNWEKIYLEMERSTTLTIKFFK